METPNAIMTNEELAQCRDYLLSRAQPSQLEKLRHLLETDIPAKEHRGGPGPLLRQIMDLTSSPMGSAEEAQQFFDKSSQYIMHFFAVRTPHIAERTAAETACKCR